MEFMKIKFPKTITIGSYVFQVKTDPKSCDGSFNYDDGIITIGTKKLRTQPFGVLEIIIHELKEVIHVEQSTRFRRGDELNNYEFHYSHKEHSELCSRLAGLLGEFIA